MLVAVAGLGAWSAGSYLGWFKRRRKDGLHWLVFVYALASAIAFAAAMMRPLTGIEDAGVFRSVVPVFAFIGIALLSYDGVTLRTRLDDLLFRLVLLVGISAAIGIVEFFISGFSYASLTKLPGFTVNTDVVNDVRSGFHRVQAAAAHPIEYSVVCAAAVPIGLHYARYASTRFARRAACTATIAMLLVLPMSVSRSALLAVGVALVIYAADWSWRTRLNATVLAVFGLLAFRAAVPGLLGTLVSLFTWASDDPSVKGRTEDYAEIPGLMAGHWWFGRGLGTFQWQQYFYLDNQYLGSLLEGGVIGIVVFGALFIVGMSLARGARKRATDAATRSLGQAITAALGALAAAAATFDELSFKQTAFVAFLLIGAAAALRRTVIEGAEHAAGQRALASIPVQSSHLVLARD